MNPNTPGVVERIENREERLFSSDLYTRLYGMGIVFLNQEIDMDNANSIIAQLLYLDASDSDRPIYLYIHSGGRGCLLGICHLRHDDAPQDKDFDRLLWTSFQYGGSSSRCRNTGNEANSSPRARDDSRNKRLHGRTVWQPL